MLARDHVGTQECLGTDTAQIIKQLDKTHCRQTQLETDTDIHRKYWTQTKLDKHQAEHRHSWTQIKSHSNIS